LGNAVELGRSSPAMSFSRVVLPFGLNTTKCPRDAAIRRSVPAGAVLTHSKRYLVFPERRACWAQGLL